MDEKDLQEFTLEDIMKEFGSQPEEEPQAVEEVSESTEVPATEIEAEAETEEEQPAVVTDATIRLDAIPDTKGTVRNAEHIDDEDEVPELPAEEEKTEPYSTEWEPEYEQPIAEYVPPRPILFHPKSRLRELKRQLVAGPEKLYYNLSEQGLGKLQLAILVNILVVLISALVTILYTVGTIGENRLKTVVFGQFLTMLISALLGSNQLVEGLADLLRKRFSLNTMLVFTFLLCCVDGVLCLKELRIPCCAAFSLQMTMSLWSAYQKRNTKLGMLDTMRKATRLDSIAAVEDYRDGMKGLLRGEGQVEDFMQTYDKPPRLEKVLSVYALVALCVSVAVGVAAGVLHGISTGIQVAAVTTLAAVPASMYVTLSRPMAVLERRHHAVGTVLCGWQGVEGLSGKGYFPITHKDVFPDGSVKLNGVKFYGSRLPDQIISYATALIEADGGSLAPLFSHLLESRNGMHYTVENFRIYDNGGIGGEVNGEPVLAGSLSFLRNMGVESPEGIRVDKAVCVAVDGELCGLFAVTYEKERCAASGISSLCGYRGLIPVLVSDDFMLTPKFLGTQFDVKTKRMEFPEAEERKQLREKTLPVDGTALALVTGEGLAPFAYAVTGAKTLKNAAVTGIAVHMTGGILGILMMLALTILGATGLLTPANMFLYELVWMIPGLLITQWTRSI